VNFNRYLAEAIEVLCNAELGLLRRVLAMGYRVEGLTWPRVIPVDCAAVDDTGELPAPISELVTDWREGQDNVEVLPADLHEIRVNLVSVVATLSISGSLAHLVADRNLLVRRVQVRDLTTVEQVVDVLKEGLFDNLGVREQEYLGLVINS